MGVRGRDPNHRFDADVTTPEEAVPPPWRQREKSAKDPLRSGRTQDGWMDAWMHGCMDATVAAPRSLFTVHLSRTCGLGARRWPGSPHCVGCSAAP